MAVRPCRVNHPGGLRVDAAYRCRYIRRTPLYGDHVAAKKSSTSAPDEGYCVKCKAKRKIDKAKEIKMANGRPAMKGVCPVCGTGMFKILPPK